MSNIKYALLVASLVAMIILISSCTQQPQEKCGNEVCGQGETFANCPQDCPRPAAVCGDRICQPGENTANCREDCPKTSRCGDDICDSTEMANPGLCPQDCDNICGNDRCESGESCSSCSEDCGTCPVETSCGDGTCNGAETTSSCPGDCPSAPSCGDGTCNGDETCSTCPDDCEACPVTPFCGDDSCSGDETCSSCPGDCGDCPVATGESRFGVHLGSLNYDSAQTHINDLGSQIWVRDNGPIYRDDYGWGKSGYVSPGSRPRTPLPSVQSNRFVNFEASRYNSSPGPATPVYPTGHEQDYIAYLDYMLDAWKTNVKYWEVGNEVDASVFWAGTPQEYANLVELASEEIKSQCPSCKVGISFSDPAITKSPTYFSVLGGICSSFDFIDAHYYRVSSIEQGDLDSFRQACPGKEFISTETGIPDNTGYQGQEMGGSLDEQAKDLIKYNTLLFHEGYGKIFWYLIDTEYPTGTIFLHNALIDESGSRKPAFTTYQTMIDKIDYFTSISKLADGQYKYTFSDKGPVYVLWCDSGSCSVPPEITGTVRVTDYQGNEQMMSASAVTLTSSPVFVETE